MPRPAGPIRLGGPPVPPRNRTSTVSVRVTIDLSRCDPRYASPPAVAYRTEPRRGPRYALASLGGVLVCRNFLSFNELPVASRSTIPRANLADRTLPMKRTLTTMLGATASLALLVGCGSDVGNDNNDTSDTSAAVPSVTAQSYPDVASLALAVSSGVGGCQDFKPNPWGEAPTSDTLGSCTVSAGGTSVRLSLSVYRSNAKFTATEQQDRGRMLRQLATINTSYYVDGPEWTIECSTIPDAPTAALSACRSIGESLGGAVTTEDGTPA